jgi:glycosyltransferase involved in cell wall biosynthesis
MSIEDPKISCLCVTRNRVEYLKQSIECFRGQSYGNKELVIVYVADDDATAKFTKGLVGDDLVIVEVPVEDNTSLGDVRNIAIENATGDYICNWDDDDWFHKDRLKIQLQSIIDSKKRASILYYLIIFDRLEKTAYTTNCRTWENSIMCEKKVLDEYGIKYPPLQKGEDTDFVDGLRDANVLFPIIRPQLYIYNYTGGNTCDKSHFERMFAYGRIMPKSHSAIVANIVNGELNHQTASEKLDSEDFMRTIHYDGFRPRSC